ncbi:MAG: IS1096 element passenger TnpR family protein, partial [Bacteroidia bacterium]
PVMRDTELADYVTENGMKLIYEYNFALLWKFLIEVDDIFNSKEKDASAFPILVSSEGEAPGQYDAVAEIIGNITDEDTAIIHHLEMKNHEFFTGDEDELDEFGDVYDVDDLDGFGEESLGRYNDDEY